MANILEVIALLNCNQEKAFAQFTKNNELESWLCVKADVQENEGGKYELFWTPDTPENNSTTGCKILTFKRNNIIQFEWKGPVQFHSFMNTCKPLTNVTVFFETVENKTKIKLSHAGWGEGKQWDEARHWFQISWSGAFTLLEKKVNSYV